MTVVEPVSAFPEAAVAVLIVLTAAVVAVAEEPWWWCLRGAAATREIMQKKTERDCMVFMLMVDNIESIDIKYISINRYRPAADVKKRK